MGTDDLRKQFVAMQKEFLGGAASKLKKHELEHRMELMKKAMALKDEVPEPEKARSGPPAAREVKTKKVAIDADTEVVKPVAPKEGKAHVANYKKKAKAEPEVEAAPVVEKPAAPKKVRKMPPKVVLPDEPVAPKPKAEAKPKVKAEPKTEEKPKAPRKPKAPKVEAPAAEPETPAPAPAALVVETPVKLPGGVRRLPETELYLN